jgi:AraC-like DNA-binding protein
MNSSAGPESFRTIPSATGGIARFACAKLREQNRDVAEILARAGLTPKELDDPTVRLEAQAQLRVLDLAAEALDDDRFGFHLARSFDLREIGLVYYVMASSDQLADALRDAERFGQIVNQGVSLRCRFEQGAAITLEYVGVDRHRDRHHIELWLVTLVRIFRAVTDTRLVPHRLRVRHVRAEAPAEFKSFFGADIEYGAEVDEIQLAPAVVSLPVVGRDTYLHRLLRQYAEEALASQPTLRASARSEVERVLPELLPHGRAGLAEVARRLAMSTRTLSRKLHDEGATFAQILDALRAALARRYLDDRDLPVSEIAWLLGYQEVSSLTHAFKRWTGMTPRQFRASARESGTADARTRS